MSIVEVLNQIVESFNTILDTKWSISPKGFIGKFTIKDVVYSIHLNITDIHQYKCAEASFAVLIDGEESIELTNNSGMDATLILGAVANAIRIKCLSENVDVILILSVDNVKRRMDIYSRAARMMAKGFGSVKSNISVGDYGSLATIVFRSGMKDKDLIISALEYLISQK
jgi:hypothetical protein